MLAKARQKLRELRLANVRVKHADGSIGLKEVAPFDAIIMAAAATHVPQELLQSTTTSNKYYLTIKLL